MLKSLPSTSAGVKSSCRTSANQSAAETSAGEDSAVESCKPIYAKKCQHSSVVRPKTIVPKSRNLGAQYTVQERELTLMRLVRRSEKIPFVDTHFHLNRLQEASCSELLDDILVNGTIQLTLTELEYAITNFIEGVPSRSIQQEFKDKRLCFIFSVYPNRPTNIHQKN